MEQVIDERQRQLLRSVMFRDYMIAAQSYARIVRHSLNRRQSQRALLRLVKVADFIRAMRGMKERKL